MHTYIYSYTCRLLRLIAFIIIVMFTLRYIILDIPSLLSWSSVCEIMEDSQLSITEASQTPTICIIYIGIYICLMSLSINSTHNQCIVKTHFILKLQVTVFIHACKH